MTKGDGRPCKKCSTSKWDSFGRCTYCRNERERRRKQNNAAAIKESKRRYRQENADAIKERDRRYYQENTAAAKERSRRWYKANPEAVDEAKRRWRQANREAIAAKDHRRRTQKTEAGGSYTPSEWEALLEHYGNKCLCCGRTDVKLAADHVVPVSKGGTSNIDNIQPLCKSCNSHKHAKTIDYRPGKGIGRLIQRKLFG